MSAAETSAVVAAAVATAVASGACMSGRVRRAGVVRNRRSVGRCAAAVSAVAAAAVVSAIRSGSAAVVRSWCIASMRGVVVVTAVGSRSRVVVCRAVVVTGRCGIVMSRAVVVCHAVVMGGSRCVVRSVMRGVVYVVHRAVVVRVVCSQMRVVVCAVVAHRVRGSNPRSVNGHCPSETYVHHRGVESQQLCYRNGVTAVVYPNVVQIHWSGNNLVGADVVTVDPHFVAQSRGLFPDIRCINIIHACRIGET